MPKRRKQSWKSRKRALVLLGGVVVLSAAVWLVTRSRPAAPPPRPATAAGHEFADRVQALAKRRGARPKDIRADDPIRKVEGVFVRRWVVTLPDRDAGSSLVADLEAEAAAWGSDARALAPSHTDVAHLRIALDGEAFDIHVRTRAPARPDAKQPSRAAAQSRPTRRPTLEPAARGKLAILLDDAGQNMSLVPAVAALPAEVAVAVLPYLPHSAETAVELHRTGHEVWLHLPMEPHGYPKADPGPGAVLVAEPEASVRATVRSALNNVPHIVGVNNHMGSRATESLRVMTWVMQEVAARGLGFIDSRTTPATVAEDAARAQGIPTARRNVFLDNNSDPALIQAQLDEAVYQARRAGEAIAIGHVHGDTVRLLDREAPRLASRGVTLVPPTKLLR